jgi:hypothetical protein
MRSANIWDMTLLYKDLVWFLVQHVLNLAKTYHRVGKMPLKMFSE